MKSGGKHLLSRTYKSLQLKVKKQNNSKATKIKSKQSLPLNYAELVRHFLKSKAKKKIDKYLKN